MATNQKMKPCPLCGTADFLAVYTYDNGWSHVECDNPACVKNGFYRGPGAGSIRQAIKSHNANCTALAEKSEEQVKS